MPYKGYTYYKNELEVEKAELVKIQANIDAIEVKKIERLKELATPFSDTHLTEGHRILIKKEFDRLVELQRPLFEAREHKKKTISSVRSKLAYIKRQDELANRELHPGPGLCAAEAERAEQNINYLGKAIHVAGRRYEWNKKYINLLLGANNPSQEIIDAQRKVKQSIKVDFDKLKAMKAQKEADKAFFNETADLDDEIVMNAYERAYKDLEAEAKFAIVEQAKPIVFDYSKTDWEKLRDKLRSVRSMLTMTLIKGFQKEIA